MRKVQPSAPAVVPSHDHVEFEVSSAYVRRQSAPARLTRPPKADVFHDSDLGPLQLEPHELSGLKSHLRSVGLLKARSLPGRFAFKHDDIDAALANAPLSPPRAELARTALTTLRHDSHRFTALRAAEARVKAAVAADPQAAQQLQPLRTSLQQEMQMPAPLLDTWMDMQRVLLHGEEALPLDAAQLPRRK